MMWWQDGMMTLITGGLLIIFRLWLELKWKNKNDLTHIKTPSLLVPDLGLCSIILWIQLNNIIEHNIPQSKIILKELICCNILLGICITYKIKVRFSLLIIGIFVIMSVLR